MKEREDVMEKVEREEEDRPIILSIPFDRRFLQVSLIVQQHYKLLLERSPGVKDGMARTPMVAYQRPANLQDLPVCAQLPPEEGGRPGVREDQEGIHSCSFMLFGPTTLVGSKIFFLLLLN